MMQIGAAVVARCRAIRFRIERAMIVGMACIAQIHLAEPRKRKAVAACPRRHDTIEHIDPARHGFQNVIRCADAHQVARLFRRQDRAYDFQHVEHDLLRFADRKPADRIALEIHGL